MTPSARWVARYRAEMTEHFDRHQSEGARIDSAKVER